MITAKRIRDIRDEKRLSQARAAATVGVAVNTWWRWEAGKSAPHAHLEAQIEAMGRGDISEAKTHEEYTSHIHGCPECQTLGFRLTRAKLETEWQG